MNLDDIKKELESLDKLTIPSFEGIELSADDKDLLMELAKTVYFKKVRPLLDAYVKSTPSIWDDFGAKFAFGIFDKILCPEGDCK